MRRAAAFVAGAALALGGCGSSEPAREEAFDPFTEVRDRTAPRTERAAPRWERVRVLSGNGPAREAFTVAPRAIQWRARWTCADGRLELAAGDAPAARAACPRAGTATGVRTGDLRLDVRASGPWRVVVEQQVDTPIREPPLAAMREPRARVVARGRFYGIERTSRGTAALHRLPDGRLAVRLDPFSVSPNTDLFVWLSAAARPRTSVAAAKARHVVLRELKSTLGGQNYLVPRDVAIEDIRSIVIWCVPVRIAYAAATLRPVR